MHKYLRYLAPALFILPAAAQPVLYACASFTKEYVVGAKLPPSGLFRRSTEGGWNHLGFKHPFMFGFEADPRDPATLFLAAGNGLIRQTAGRWTTLTGSDVTELRDVSVTPRAIYFAHSAGIRATEDGGKTWREIGSTLHRRFTETVRADASKPGVLLAGGEEGIFRSEDDGKTWRRAGAAGAQVLRIEQSPHDSCYWLAGTQDSGLFASRDCGVTFENSGAIGAGSNLYDIAFDPTTPSRIALAGWNTGVTISTDGGKTWQSRNVGLPEPQVSSVAFDPSKPGRLFAAVHEQAIYRSEDAGATWTKDGLDGSHVNRLRFLGAQAAKPRTPQSSFDARMRSVIEANAHPKNLKDAGYGAIAARLWLHEDAAWCSERLLQLLAAEPSGDMFWMYPVTAIAHLDRGQLTPAARKALRDAWRTYAPYRGDTENHWLLYYSSLYLMAQLYPDDGPEAWYTGKSSQANFEEARTWIESWVKLTTTRGQGEYDSPHYISVYLIPMSYLAAWARDPTMKKRATMMLDYLIADYAPENLDGTYVGAQSRVYDKQLLEKSSNVANDFGWMWFGLGRPLEPPDGFLLFYLLASGYEPPEILRGIATDRSAPYTHYERKRTRNRWRFNDELHGPVYKTTYVRREYAVSSDQGGVLQPIQQHSWDVTWSVPDARGVQNTFFFLNPHSSLHELQTYFVFAPDTGIEDVVQSKKMYDSPDKFSGGSPYEKIMQDRDTVIALYDIEKDARFPHVNGFFSKDLVEVREDPSGWIFMRGGDTFIACRPLQPHTWKSVEGGGRRLFSPYLKNGVVVQAAAASEYADLDAFRRAILALPLQVKLDPVPSVQFRSLRGSLLEFTYGDTPRVDGRPMDYASWPLFGGPFLESAVDSRVLTIKYGSKRRVLDFRSLEISETQ